MNSGSGTKAPVLERNSPLRDLCTDFWVRDSFYLNEVSGKTIFDYPP